MSKRPDIGKMEVWRELGTATDEAAVKAYKEAKLIDIDKIKPNPQQPRKTFNEDALEELSNSIREKGLLQPIVVRPSGDEFIIVAGHRRCLACQMIGMEYIPSVVRDVTEQDALEHSLIENVQREDIDPVEEAVCYRQLMDEHGYSVRDMASKVHKSVGYIHSRLTLLKHDDIAQSVQEQQIGIFEARELSKVEDEEIRRDLTEKAATGELDRNTLKHAVRVATGRSEAEEIARDDEPAEKAATTPKATTEAAEPAVVETRQETTVEVTAPTEPAGDQMPLAIEGEPAFNQEALYTRWEALKQDLMTLDMNNLTEEQRNEARRFLEAIRDTIEEILK